MENSGFRGTGTRYFLFILLSLFLVGCRSHPKDTASAAALPAPSPTAESTPVAALAVPNPASTPAPNVLANGWYQYIDPAGEFAFGYPTDAVITAGQNPLDGSKNILIQFLIPEQPYQGMSIRVEPNPKQLAAADLAIQFYEKNAQKPAAAAFTSSLQGLQVGGLPAVKASIPSANTELTIFVPYDIEAYILAPVHDLAANQVAPETLALFYQVLDTMKFGSVR